MLARHYNVPFRRDDVLSELRERIGQASRATAWTYRKPVNAYGLHRHVGEFARQQVILPFPLHCCSLWISLH